MSGEGEGSADETSKQQPVPAGQLLMDDKKQVTFRKMIYFVVKI